MTLTEKDYELNSFLLQLPQGKRDALLLEIVKALNVYFFVSLTTKHYEEFHIRDIINRAKQLGAV